MKQPLIQWQDALRIISFRKTPSYNQASCLFHSATTENSHKKRLLITQALTHTHTLILSFSSCRAFTSCVCVCDFREFTALLRLECFGTKFVISMECFSIEKWLEMNGKFLAFSMSKSQSIQMIYTPFSCKLVGYWKCQLRRWTGRHMHFTGIWHCIWIFLNTGKQLLEMELITTGPCSQYWTV